MEKSSLDIAFELVSKKKGKVAFTKLWKEVSEIQGLSEEQAAQRAGSFYTLLSLDGRFITFSDYTWDLRTRHEYKSVHELQKVVIEENSQEDKEDAAKEDSLDDTDPEEDDDSLDNSDEEEEDTSTPEAYN